MNPTKKRILVVDDDPKITRQIRLNLELTGNYEVREENDALHSVKAVREFQSDLVLLDVMMPGLDGGEIASRIRAIPAFKNLPIVFLTAAVTASEVNQKHGRIGGERFLAKPVEPAALVVCLEEELQHPACPAPATSSDEPNPHLAY